MLKGASVKSTRNLELSPSSSRHSVFVAYFATTTFTGEVKKDILSAENSVGSFILEELRNIVPSYLIDYYSKE